MEHTTGDLEKDSRVGFQNTTPGSSRKSKSSRFAHLTAFCAAIFLTAITVRQLSAFVDVSNLKTPTSKVAVCPSATPITPVTHSSLLQDLEAEYATEDFQTHVYATLSGAVQIPTEMFDDIGEPGQDPRWDVFADFHSYIDSRFPLIHKNLRRTKVKTYGLVYQWQGSNTDVKPILFTAHQDVVPVEPSTVQDWINPPYSGYWDGKWIWGRGSCDDKVDLMGSLTTIEKLLEKGFKPQRTIVLAFGIDEERGGNVGAKSIRDYLLATFGENGFAMLIDEGGNMEATSDGMLASPGVAEKGYFDLRMSVSADGGHSSVPPKHTSIGILAALIAQLEANPHTPHIFRHQAFYTTLQCQALIDTNMDDELRTLISKSQHSDKALVDLEKKLFAIDGMAEALSKTTQAVDIIHGGVKSNALPENAFAIVNHRIAQHSSVSAVKTHLAEILSPLAEKFNLTFDAFGDGLNATSGVPSSGLLRLAEAWDSALEPAPVTPWIDNPAFDFVAGTIQTVARTSKRWNNTNLPVAVAPGIMSGNTDTKHYWKLTKNIFRYRHVSRFDKYNGAHTVNEAILAEAFIDLIRFFTFTILNADETTLLA